MQSLEKSKELEMAINSIEILLNGKDGELVLDAIKQYKEHKTMDQNMVLRLQKCISI